MKSKTTNQLPFLHKEQLLDFLLAFLNKNEILLKGENPGANSFLWELIALKREVKQEMLQYITNAPKGPLCTTHLLIMLYLSVMFH